MLNCTRALLCAQVWDIVMHGGEFYDGEKDKMHCYGDVYVYSVLEDSWRQIVIPNRCRCSDACWPCTCGAH